MCVVEEENRFCWGMLGGLCACLEHWRLCKALAVHRVMGPENWLRTPSATWGNAAPEKSACAHVSAVSEARAPDV